MKKQDVLKVLEGCNSVVTRCELLGTERTEILNEVQKAEAGGEYSGMHTLYLEVAAAKAKLDAAVSTYLLSVGNNKALNFETLRNGVKTFAEKHEGKSFVTWFDANFSNNSSLPVFFSVSVLASKINEIFEEYVKTLNEVNQVRKSRESIKDRKARLLAELKKIEAVEAAAEVKQK